VAILIDGKAMADPHLLLTESDTGVAHALHHLSGRIRRLSRAFVVPHDIRHRAG
jgi:hypothetical protein